jgi:hypothetical protein
MLRPQAEARIAAGAGQTTAHARWRGGTDAGEYMAVWLPTPLWNAALTGLPCLHSYEMIRAGLFGDKIQTFTTP